MFEKPTIAILGLGHVGLLTALGFSELGWKVIGADNLREKANQIRAGVAPFYEPGLQDMLSSALRSGRFEVALNVQSAIENSDVIFVCVGTPQNEDGSADLSQIEAVGRLIAEHANSNKLVVEKSTTSVFTAKRLKDMMEKHKNLNWNIDVAVNPEFLREGTGLKDFLEPDRIVLGVESDSARDQLVTIYSPLLSKMDNENTGVVTHRNAKFVITDLNTAEIIKHASNSFLATKISFINSVADVCDKVGADIVKVAEAMGMDPRIGPSFLNAGIGFGGYCLPKDIKAFSKIGEDVGIDMAIFRAVSSVNEHRFIAILDKLKSSLGGLNGKCGAIWGLAFKPGTDDIRESPCVPIIKGLIDQGISVHLHDPEAINQFKKVMPRKPGLVEYFDSPEQAAKGTDFILITTEWQQYLQVNLSNIRDTMSNPLLIDCRNMLNPTHVRDAGFQYVGIGRPFLDKSQ